MKKVTAKVKKSKLQPPKEQHCGGCNKHFKDFISRCGHQCLPHVCLNCGYSFATDAELIIHNIHCKKITAIVKAHPGSVNVSRSDEKLSSSKTLSKNRMKSQKKLKHVCQSLDSVNLYFKNDIGDQNENSVVNKHHVGLIPARNIKTNAREFEKKSKAICSPTTVSMKCHDTDKLMNHWNVYKKSPSKHDNSREFSKQVPKNGTNKVMSESVQSVVKTADANKRFHIESMGNELNFPNVSKESCGTLNDSTKHQLAQLSNQNRKNKKIFLDKANGVRIQINMQKDQHNASKLNKIESENITSKSGLISKQSTEASNFINRSRKNKNAKQTEQSNTKIDCSDNDLGSCDRFTAEVMQNTLPTFQKGSSNMMPTISKQLSARKRFLGKKRLLKEMKQTVLSKKICVRGTESKELETIVSGSFRCPGSNTEKNDAFFCEQLNQIADCPENAQKNCSRISTEVMENILSSADAERSNAMQTVSKQQSSRKRNFEKSEQGKEQNVVRKKICLRNNESKGLKQTVSSNSNCVKSNTDKNVALFRKENINKKLNCLEPQNRFEDVVSSLPAECAVLLKAPNDEFKCSKCCKQFKTLKGASSHYIDCKCTIKNISFIEKDVIWVCVICHQSIVNVSKISEHIKSCQNISENSKLCKKHCQMCGQTCFSMHLFENHDCIKSSLVTCRVVLEKISIEGAVNINNASAYACNFCSKEFFTESNLKAHADRCTFRNLNCKQDSTSLRRTRVSIKTERTSPEGSTSSSSVPVLERAKTKSLRIHSEDTFVQYRNIDNFNDPEIVCNESNNFVSYVDLSSDCAGNGNSLQNDSHGSDLPEDSLLGASGLSSCSETMEHSENGSNQNISGSLNMINGVDFINNQPNKSENVESVLEMLSSVNNICTCKHKKGTGKTESKPCILCINDVNKVRNVYRKISKNPAAILNLPVSSRSSRAKKTSVNCSSSKPSTSVIKTKADITGQTPLHPSKGGPGYPTPPVSPYEFHIEDSLNILKTLPEDTFIDIFAITKLGTTSYSQFICAVCTTFTTHECQTIIKHHLEIHKKHEKLNVVPIPEVDPSEESEDYLNELGMDF